MASLKLDRISKHYDDTAALSSVDLMVEDGEFCVLLGPSGCGKSTLLQIVAGLTRPDEGSVSIDGQSVDGLTPRERDVAMVFQSYALYPHMTVAQNLAFGLRMRGFSKDDVRRKVEETAGLLEIEKLLNRRPRELSGGQRQRVAMGRALVRRPRLFLLDEPLSNLDARLRINVRLELKRLHARIRSTILYVTHDQVEAMTLGDKVVVMKEGRIHQVGVPESIYDRPADRFVASFIGSPPMNLLSGKVARLGSRLQFRGKDFSLDLSGLPSSLDGSTVDLGIRPEDIKIIEGSPDALWGKVEMVSNLGSEKYVHVRLGTDSLTVHASKEDLLRPGETIPLDIDPCRLHIFHEGRRI